MSVGAHIAVLAALLGGCSALMKGSFDRLRTGERQFSEDELAQLKRTTTVFFLRSADEPRRDEFEKAIERAWHLTEIEVAPFSHLSEYADPTKYSHLVIEGESLSSYPLPFYHLTLIARSPGEDEDESIGYCRIELQSTIAFMKRGFESGGGDSPEEVYHRAEFLNWSPALIATYLQSVQADLEHGWRRKMLDELEDTERMKRLRTATLYVPDHLLVGLNADESKRLDAKELLSEYPGRFQIVTHDALESLIARSEALEDPIFVFDYVVTAPAKIVSIYEYGRGMIYREKSILGGELNADDFDVF